VDLSILRAVPYVVARVMGRWLVAFSVAGLRIAAGNFNIVIDGDGKRAKYASRDGDRCTVGDLLFNYCVEMETTYSSPLATSRWPLRARRSA
jgi:hypothetical protein